MDGVPVLASVGYFPFGGASGWTWGNGEPYSRNYDLDGRVKAITLGPSAGLYAGLSQAFGYDSLNRLVTANLAAGQAQTFSYDANGNRTNATVNAASTTYTYPTTSHRLSSLSGATTRSFAYDNAGNLTSSAGITYTYDGRGRMKQAGTATYAINGLGQRVKKNNGTDVFFAYDEAGHLIGEYDATGAPIEETVWLGDLPVAVMKPNGASFDLFYVWSDNLGTPREITDTANQERWEWPNADPFGNNAPNENPAGLGVFSYNLRFPGQYYDAEKASNYNYFRDYDPSIGRYVESDPIGLEAGPDTYRYVGQNPLLLVDPAGLDPLYCQYSQSSGHLTCFDLQTDKQIIDGRCYSGRLKIWKDNPLYNDTPDRGPTPRGCWEMGHGRPMPSGGRLPPTIPLKPVPGRNTVWGTKRDPRSFWIHGDNAKHDASAGCMICNKKIRQLIDNHSGGELNVTN